MKTKDPPQSNQNITQLVGAIWEKDSCRFSVWAPFAKKVEVEITSKNKIIPLQPGFHGYWQTIVMDVIPGDRYFFILDGKKLPDPASKFQPEGVHGPSEIVDPNYEWKDQSWKNIPLGDMIIYELHPGTFTNSGDFEGIISKLSYLKDLGINAIELMPVAQFPGVRNWGYDGAYPFAVQNSYGGPFNLKKLVNECHNEGIAVILDVVYNHLGPEGNYLGEYGPYFTEKYQTPWGKAINFDDAYSDPVRHYFIQNALMWFDEYHIDGIRLDAVHAIYDFGAYHIMHELSNDVKFLGEKQGRKYHLIAESDLNDTRYIKDEKRGGYALDGQWTDDFHHALHALVTGEQQGYYQDFGELHHLHKTMQNTFVYDGVFSKYRNKKFGNKTNENTYDQFVVFSQNHDQIGNRLAGDRLTENISYECYKLCAATVILSPYVPMLFMGEEFAEKNPFQYFIDHGDSGLIEAVRQGRRREFKAFNWEGDIPDPQSEETFNACKLNWKFHEDSHQQAMFEFYKELIRIRKSIPVFKHKDRKSLVTYRNDQTKLMFIERFGEKSNLYFVMNFDEKDQDFEWENIKPENKKILDSAEEKWLGPGTASPETYKEKSTIKAHSALIYEASK